MKFNETVNIQANTVRGGASTATAQKLSAWASQGIERKARQREQQAFEAGQQKQVQRDEQGQLLVPEEQKAIMGFIGSRNVDAHNRGLRNAYVAAIDRDNMVKLNEISETNRDSTKGFDSEAEAYRKAVLSNIDPEARGIVEASLDEQVARTRLGIQSREIKRQAKETLDTLSLSAGDYANEAAKQSRLGNKIAAGENLLKSRAAMDAYVDAGGDKTQAELAFRQFERGVMDEQFLSSLDEMSSGEVLETLAKAEKKVPKGYQVDEWDSLIARGFSVAREKDQFEKAQLAKQKEALRNVQAGLELAINLDEGEPDELIKTAQALFEAKAYTPQKYASIVADIINNGGKRADLETRLAGDQSVVVDKATVDSGYDRKVRGGEIQTPADKINFAKNVGAVPKALKAEVDNGLKSTDIEVFGAAVDTMDRLDEQMGLTDAFTSEQRAFADNVSTLYPYYGEKAFDMALKRSDPRDAARVQAAEETLKKAHKNNAERAEFYFDRASSAVGGVFSGSDKATTGAEIANDYKAVYESLIIAGTSEKKAEEKADQLIKAQWTKFNGHFTKHAPDKFYGEPEEINSQLKTDIIDSVMLTGELEDYYLLSDDRTSREATQGNPSYLVRYKDENGWDILPMRFVPERIEKDFTEELQKVRSKGFSKGKIELDKTMAF